MGNAYFCVSFSPRAAPLVVSHPSAADLVATVAAAVVMPSRDNDSFACSSRQGFKVLKNESSIPGHAGGQGYEPPPSLRIPVVTYELYVVDPP